MALAAILMVLGYFAWSNAKWWLLGVLILIGAEKVGEDQITRWLFFISIVAAATWLVAITVFGVQL